MKPSRWIGLLAVGAIAASCSGKTPPGHGQGGEGSAGSTASGTGPGGSAGCADVPAQIFASKCGTAGCHGPQKPAANLDLASPGVADRVVGQPGGTCVGILADPAHPSSSLLYKKLLPKLFCGARMPLGSTPLSDGEIACVKDWIAARGAGGTGGTGGTGGAGGLGGAGGSGGGGPGTCTDGLKNGVETDVDCGGLCPLCPVGKACAGPTDCESFACAGGACAAATCTDQTANGGESDVDCGGPCPPCAGGKRCTTAADCASADCQANALCASSCTDGAQDGLEKGVDCGGVCPLGCPPGAPCDAASDCASDICTSGACVAPTCTDLMTNGGESDVDCGGPCAPCAIGQKCHVTGDCVTGGCVAGVCEHVLTISEVKTRGANGNHSADEFIELYNPGTVPIIMDATWKVTSRNVVGGCQDVGYGTALFVGAGQTVPPDGHILFAGPAYAQSPSADGGLLNAPSYGAISDAGSLTLLHHGQLVETMCYFIDSTTMNDLTTCAPAYPCAGPPVDNTQALTSMDVSLERKPGGAMGSGQNTGSSAADFMPIAPSQPQSLMSPPTP